MKFKSIQDMLNHRGSENIVEVENGTVRSATSKEVKLRSDGNWRIFVPRNEGGVTLKGDTNLIDIAGQARAILVGFNIWGGPHFEDIEDLCMIGCTLTFPVREFDALSSTVKNRLNKRCRAIYLQSSKRVSMLNCDVHDAGSGVLVSKSLGFQMFGTHIWGLGPSRDPYWHTDTLGLVGGGTEDMHIQDSYFEDYVRFVFEDGQSNQSGRAHKNFVFKNIWAACGINVPFQFNISGEPPAPITGHLENVRLWKKSSSSKFDGTYRMEDPPTKPRTFMKDGSRINIDPRWINVTENDVKVVARSPVEASPLASWRDLDDLDIAKYLHAYSR